MAGAVPELGKSTFWLLRLQPQPYAASGIPFPFATRLAGMCFFNHRFARQRPMNGATATNPKATANAIRIRNISFVYPGSLSKIVRG